MIQNKTAFLRWREREKEKEEASAKAVSLSKLSTYDQIEKLSVRARQPFLIRVLSLSLLLRIRFSSFIGSAENLLQHSSRSLSDSQQKKWIETDKGEERMGRKTENKE
jgi:hypothetical protein